MGGIQSRRCVAGFFRFSGEAISRAELANGAKGGTNGQQDQRAMGSLERDEDKTGAECQEAGDEESAIKARELEVLFHTVGSSAYGLGVAAVVICLQASILEERSQG